MLHNLQRIESCTFSTNQPVLLRDSTVADLTTRCKDRVEVNVVIIKDSNMLSVESNYCHHGQPFKWQRYPILIEPGIKYTIRLQQSLEYQNHEYKSKGLKTEAHLDSGLIIHFHDDELEDVWLNTETSEGWITGLVLLPVPKDFPY